MLAVPPSRRDLFHSCHRVRESGCLLSPTTHRGCLPELAKHELFVDLETWDMLSERVLHYAAHSYARSDCGGSVDTRGVRTYRTSQALARRQHFAIQSSARVLTIVCYIQPGRRQQCVISQAHQQCQVRLFCACVQIDKAID